MHLVGCRRCRAIGWAGNAIGWPYLMLAPVYCGSKSAPPADMFGDLDELHVSTQYTPRSTRNGARPSISTRWRSADVRTGQKSEMPAVNGKNWKLWFPTKT